MPNNEEEKTDHIPITESVYWGVKNAKLRGAWGITQTLKQDCSGHDKG